jgi:hypothetical protein
MLKFPAEQTPFDMDTYIFPETDVLVEVFHVSPSAFILQSIETKVAPCLNTVKLNHEDANVQDF